MRHVSKGFVGWFTYILWTQWISGTFCPCLFHRLLTSTSGSTNSIWGARLNICSNNGGQGEERKGRYECLWILLDNIYLCIPFMVCILYSVHIIYLLYIDNLSRVVFILNFCWLFKALNRQSLQYLHSLLSWYNSSCLLWPQKSWHVDRS